MVINVSTISEIVNASNVIKWEDLIHNSSEVIIFGSWAQNLNTSSSDLDILCIDFQRRIKTKHLEIISYPSSGLCKTRWLESELANHIAAYGMWIKGEGSWKRETRISQQTIYAKAEKIATLLAILTIRSGSKKAGIQGLMPKLRRDLQRLVLLEKGEAPPSRPHLDILWSAPPYRTNLIQKASVILERFSPAISMLIPEISAMILNSD